MRIRQNTDLFEAICKNQKCESYGREASIYVKKNQAFPSCPFCRKKLQPGLHYEASMVHQKQVLYRVAKAPGAAEVVDLD